MMKYDAKDLQSARVYLTEVYERRGRTLGKSDRATLSALAVLVEITRQLGDAEETEKNYRELVELRVQALGETDPDTDRDRRNFAFFLHGQGTHGAAAEVQRAALRARLLKISPDDIDTLIVAHTLGAYLLAANQLDEAEQVFRDTLDRRRRLLGPVHGNTIATGHQLGVVLMRKGDFAGAHALLHEAAENLTSVEKGTIVSRDHPVKVSRDYGDCLRALNRFAEAERHLLEAVKSCQQVGGSADLQKSVKEKLVSLYDQWGKPEEAGRWRRMLSDGSMPER